MFSLKHPKKNPDLKSKFLVRNQPFGKTGSGSAILTGGKASITEERTDGEFDPEDKVYKEQCISFRAPQGEFDPEDKVYKEQCI